MSIESRIAWSAETPTLSSAQPNAFGGSTLAIFEALPVMTAPLVLKPLKPRLFQAQVFDLKCFASNVGAM